MLLSVAQYFQQKVCLVRPTLVAKLLTDLRYIVARGHKGDQPLIVWVEHLSDSSPGTFAWKMTQIRFYKK